MQPSTTMQETELMEPSSTIQETELIVPPSTIPQVSVEDRLCDDSNRNRDIQNNMILAFLGLLGFLLIILVIGFS